MSYTFGAFDCELYPLSLSLSLTPCLVQMGSTLYVLNYFLVAIRGASQSVVSPQTAGGAVFVVRGEGFSTIHVVIRKFGLCRT